MRFLISAMLLAGASIATAATIPMMDFPVKNGATGEVYKMSAHPNTVWVFESYRLSCTYCNENAPNVDKLSKDYKSNVRVQVIDAGLDTSDDQYAEWIRSHAPNHLVVQDTGFSLFKALKQTNYIPQAFVVNCKGELVGGVTGTWDPTAEATVRAYVNKALETTCTN